MLPNPVIPPAAKIAVAPTPPAEPVAPATPPAEPVVPAAPATEKPAKADFAKSTSDKIGEALAKESAAKKGTPEAKPEEKTEVAPEDKTLAAEIESETKGMDAKAKQGFTKLRYENRDLARQLREAQEQAKESAVLKGQIEELKKATPATPGSDPSVEKLRSDYEALQKRVEEQEQELTVGRLEATQAFREAVATPKKVVQDAVAKFAEKHSLDANKLFSALSEGEEGADRLSEMLADAEKPIPQFEQLRLIEKGSKLQEIAEKEAVLRANAKETLEKISARTSTETEAQKTARQAELATALDKGWKDLTASLPVLAPVEGEDAETKAWNTAIEDAARFGKETDFASLDPSTQAAVLHRAAAHPLLAGTVTALQAQLDAQVQELATLTEELEKFRASRPSADAKGSRELPAAADTGDWVSNVNARMDAAFAAGA